MGTATATSLPRLGQPAIAEPAAPIHAGAKLASRVSLCVYDDPQAIRPIWEELEAQGTASVYQRYSWVETSLKTLDRHCQPFIVTGFLDGKPAFILPLAISGKFVRMLRWVGGNHSNFNMGLYSNAFIERARPADIEALMRRIRALVPGAGVLKLCCQPAAWQGRDNPMLALPHQASMNPAFMMDLRGGFEALLARGNSKRKRKKFRQQCRQLETIGGHRLLIAQTPAEVDRLAETFFDQKSRRLRELGIANAFGNADTQAFIKRMALRSLDMDAPVLQLFALEAGGRIVAVFGGGVHGRHLSGYFTSIDNQAQAPNSPGEMLLYLLAEHSAESGLEFIDLGNGDERYKRSWCNERIEMVDVILPLSGWGVPFCGAIRLGYAVKRIIRQNPYLWSLVCRLRAARGRLMSAAGS